jgi:hypothetical protein
MTTSNEHWPKGLREIAQVIGEEAALILAGEIGGVSFYVPETPKEGHWLVDLIGLDVMGELCAVYGKDYITIPQGAFLDDKKGQIKRLWNTGDHSKRQIAIKTKSTERYVRLVINGHDGPRQGTLPLE